MYSGYLERYKQLYQLTDNIKKTEKEYENNKYKECIL
jgi:hypothetical protein